MGIFFMFGVDFVSVFFDIEFLNFGFGQGQGFCGDRFDLIEFEFSVVLGVSGDGRFVGNLWKDGYGGNFISIFL